MSEKVNIKQALCAFQKIIDEGQRVDGKYSFQGITGFTDFDGYTVTLCNQNVRLEIYFHNKHSLTFDSNRNKVLFLQSIDRLSS